MGFLKKLVSGSTKDKQPKTAREAFPLAQKAIEDWSAANASRAQLCCVYTSTEDADRELGCDGRSRGWHFDFYLPALQSFYLVRVTDGKARGWERRLGNQPVEYIYALYGSAATERMFSEPRILPDAWVDTDIAAEAAMRAFRREMSDIDPADQADYVLLTLVYLAPYVRYLHPKWEPALLHRSAPEDPCCAAILSHVDVDSHDLLIVYVNAVTGEEAGWERFRFPPLVIVGSSMDW